jgi:hypothetical protein
MDSNKMSEVIRSIAGISLDALFIAATGYEPSVSQIADVTEYIETRYGVYAEEEQETTSPVVTAVAEPKVKRTYTKRKKTIKSPEYLVDWKDPDVQSFLDVALDGNEHVFSYAELNSIMPFSKMKFSVFSHYLRKTARRRGMATVNFKRDFKARTVYIAANPTLS